MNQLTDTAQREEWAAWTREHPGVRTSITLVGEPGQLPRSVAAVALAALERMSSGIKQGLHRGDMGEDDALDAENDISFINSIEQLIIENLHASCMVSRLSG